METQLVLNVGVTKAFSQPRASTPIHQFRVGGDGSSMIDLTTPLEGNGVYTLRSNFTLLIVRVNGSVRLDGLSTTYTENNGIKEYDKFKLLVNGFTVITQPIHSLAVTNLSNQEVTLTIVGCCASTAETATTYSQKPQSLATEQRLVSTLTVSELEALIHKLIP